MKLSWKSKVCLAMAATVPFLIAGVVFMTRKDDSGEGSGLQLTEQEAMEQSREREYRVVCENVTYTFRADGQLVIEGNGKTPAFQSLEESQSFFLEEIYKEHTGENPDAAEQLPVFRCVLDRVEEIVIKEGITELGEGSCAPFYYTERVVLPESLERVEEFAFLGTGQFADEVLMYEGKEPAKIEQEPAAFLTAAEISAEKQERTEQPEVNLRPMEEQGTVPATEQLIYSAAMGEDVTYSLYSNGVMVVSGSGATYDFEHYSVMEEYLMEQLHCLSRTELRERWFDNVTEIVIESSVERIGDNALALYQNAVVVTYEEK